jgi:hypothetical protein
MKRNPVDVGRAIRALRRYQVVDPSKRRTYYWQSHKKRRYSDKEIRDILSLTESEFNEAKEAYHPRVEWSAQDYASKVITWAKKNGRWPTMKEYKVSNDLPGISPTRARWYNRWNGQWNRTDVRPSTMEEFIIDTPNLFRRLTPELILGIRAIHTRREAMEKYGMDKLISKGGGELLQQDDYGKLWKLPPDNTVDEHSLYVEVVNSSPEPDGSFAHYFLRVPPDVETAKTAIEWSFPDIKALGVELNVLVQT